MAQIRAWPHGHGGARADVAGAVHDAAYLSRREEADLGADLSVTVHIVGGSRHRTPPSSRASDRGRARR